MSIKNQLNLLRAIKTAGFKLVNSNSVDTHDGACWEATLAHGSQKLVRVFNGGYGGPDETDFLQTPKLQMGAIKAQLAKLFSLPVVQDLVKESMIRSEGYSLDAGNITQEEFDAKKAEILASTVAPTTDAIEIAVQVLADASDTLKHVKREVKKGLCAAIDDDDAEGGWHTWKAPDTPENRDKIKAKRKVDYFLADLITGL